MLTLKEELTSALIELQNQPVWKEDFNTTVLFIMYHNLISLLSATLELTDNLTTWDRFDNTGMIKSIAESVDWIADNIQLKDMPYGQK